jgi:hypothetical protein
MSDRIIQIERKRYDNEHWIKPAPQTGNTEQQYRVFFDGDEIGSWSDPECSAARWLLENGKAARSDTLKSQRLRNGEITDSLFGKLGWFADHTVVESKRTGGTPRFVRWRPMPKSVRWHAAGKA